MPARIPDLGLSGNKFPDLTNPSTRERLSPAAIAALLRIVEKWQLKNEDAMALLGGVSNGRYYALKRTEKGLLTQDELTRVSLLIGIFKALNTLFSEKLANEWMTRPNNNPTFQHMTPLAFAIRGGVPAMLTLRRLLDSRRS